MNDLKSNIDRVGVGSLIQLSAKEPQDNSMYDSNSSTNFKSNYSQYAYFQQMMKF